MSYVILLPPAPATVTQLQGGVFHRQTNAFVNFLFDLPAVASAKTLIDLTAEVLPRIIQLIIAFNAIIFFAWQTLPSTFMKDHFTTKKNGKIHAIFLSAFSHSDLNHLLGNMGMLATFGAPVAEKLQPQLFLGVVFVTVVINGIVETFLRPYSVYFLPKEIRERVQGASSLGFSGSVLPHLPPYT